MGARAEGTKNVAAIQLTRRKEIQRSGEKSDPGGAANGMKEKIADGNAWMKYRCEETEDQWNSEDDVGAGGIRESGDKLGVEDSIDERGNGEKKAYERARRADVEQGTGGADGRADQDECTESANERGSGDEERVARANVMMAAGKKMAEFVRQKNEEESEREGEAAQEGGRMAIEERQGANKFIDRDGLVLVIGNGKLSAGGETGTEGKQKEHNGEKESLQGWTPANESGIGFRRRERRPVKSRGRCIFWGRVGHEKFSGAISI